MATHTLDEFFERYPSMLLFAADAAGVLSNQTRAFTERFGARASRGETLASLAVAHEREKVESFLRELATAEGPRRITFTTPEGDGHASVRCEAQRGPTGTIHGALELLGQAEPTSRVERALLRTIMDNFEIVLWAVDSEGKFVYHDGKAVLTSGLEPGQLLGQNIRLIYPPELLAPVEVTLAGRAHHYTSENYGVHWESWHHPLKDEAGATEFCIGVSLDVTESVLARREIERQLETIRGQQRAIHELSTPLIQVWDHVLVVPLIGLMDEERASELTERLLAEVARSAVHFAILDFTGVEALDGAIAAHVLKLVSSLSLLGAEAMITGVSPRVAQTMIEQDIEFGATRLHRTLREALRDCMKAQLAW